MNKPQGSFFPLLVRYENGDEVVVTSVSTLRKGAVFTVLATRYEGPKKKTKKTALPVHEKFWLVWKKGTLPRFQHKHEYSATAEARRLSILNMGSTFYVLEAVGRHMVNPTDLVSLGKVFDAEKGLPFSIKFEGTEANPPVEHWASSPRFTDVVKYINANKEDRHLVHCNNVADGVMLQSMFEVLNIPSMFCSTSSLQEDRQHWIDSLEEGKISVLIGTDWMLMGWAPKTYPNQVWHVSSVCELSPEKAVQLHGRICRGDSPAKVKSLIFVRQPNDLSCYRLIPREKNNEYQVDTAEG